MSDREQFTEARDAFKAKHHEQRLENATYTAVEMNVLTEAALQLGRNEMREEIAALCEKRLTYTANRGRRLELQELAAELRGGLEIGTKEDAPPAPATDGCTSTHPMASHIPCRKAAGHPGDHESRNGRNWRPREDGAR